MVMGIAASGAMQVPAFQAHAKTLAYMTLPDIGKVEIIDTATNTVVTTLALGDYPEVLAASPSGKYVYVPASGMLFVIDTAKQAVISAPAAGRARQIALSPDGTHFYLFDGGAVRVGDATTNEPGDAVFLGDGEWNSMGVARDDTVYVATRTRVGGPRGFGEMLPVSVLAIIDRATRTVTQVNIPGTNPNNIVFNPRADFGYVLSETGIEVLDTATNTISKTILGAKYESAPGLFPIGMPPEAIEVFLRAVFSSDGARAYVYGGNTNRIVVIDTAKQEQIASIPLSGSFEDFALTPDGSRLYVIQDEYAGSPGLTVIDTAANKIIGTALDGTDIRVGQIVIVSVPDVPPPTPCVPTAQCAALVCTGDRNGDGAVTVNEIMSAVNNGLNGCPVSPQ